MILEYCKNIEVGAIVGVKKIRNLHQVIDFEGDNLKLIDLVLGKIRIVSCQDLDLILEQGEQ